MSLDRKFPSVPFMERAARKRIPGFAFDYLSGGIGREQNLRANLSAMENIKLKPRYLMDGADQPDMTHTLLGETYDAPFLVSPMGLSGLMWPKAPEHLARAAKIHNIPFVLSGFSTSSLEDIATVTGACKWFQHYVAVDQGINQDVVSRAKAASCEVLMITIDIPTVTRREKDIANGLSIPPQFDLQTLWQIMTRPRWALATAVNGVPRFRGLEPYLPKGMSLAELGVFIGDMVDAHITPKTLQWFRDNWPGKLMVKGVLNPEDARIAKEIGVDGMIVSNHGGRQLDAARTAPEAMGAVRDTIGPDMPMLADGGVRYGVDIARLLALGADFVPLGRAFAFAMGAMGPKGADHVTTILKDELRSTMGQLGCPRVCDLPDFLDRQESE